MPLNPLNLPLISPSYTAHVLREKTAEQTGTPERRTRNGGKHGSGVRGDIASFVLRDFLCICSVIPQTTPYGSAMLRSALLCFLFPTGSFAALLTTAAQSMYEPQSKLWILFSGL